MIHRLPFFWVLRHASLLRMPTLVLPMLARPMPRPMLLLRRFISLSLPREVDS
jgi:hypothetical protein